MAPSRRQSMSDVTEDDDRIPLDRRMRVSCRLIPTDQWLTTHVDATWTVRFAKIYLLARCSDPAKPFLLPPSLYHPPPVTQVHIRSSQPQEITTADARSPSPASSTRSSLLTTSANNDDNAPNSDGGSDEAQLVFAIDPHDELGSDESSDDDILGPSRNLYRQHQYPSRRARDGVLSALPPSTRSVGSHDTRSVPFSSSSHPSSSTTIIPPTLVTHQLPFSINSLLQTTSEQTKHETYIHDRAIELNADSYTLCSFTTGQTLEEHLTLSSYRFRPGELFEIQRKHAKVHLSRLSYSEPYFDAPVFVHVTKEKESKTSSSSPHPSASGDLLPSPSFSQSSLSLQTRVETPIQTNSPLVGPPPVVVQTHYHHAHSPSAGSSTSASSRPAHQRQHSKDGFIGIGGMGLNGMSSAPTPHRQPYRSQSAHFYPNQSNSSTASSSKGKEKEKDRESMMTVSGSFLPMNLYEGFSGSMQTIGSAAKLKSDHRLNRDGFGRKEKEREREREKGAEKLKNWKTRWLVVKDGVFKIWKDVSNDLTAMEQYNLSSLKAVKEVPVPVRVYEKTPNVGTVSLISVHFLVPREAGDSIHHHHHHMPWKDTQSHHSAGGAHSSRRPGLEVTVKIRLLDTETHDHLLRVLYRCLKTKSTAPKTNDRSQQTPSVPTWTGPTPSSIALKAAAEITRTRSRSLSPKRKLRQRVSLRRSKRAESPNASSYSRAGSRNSSVASLRRFKDNRDTLVDHILHRRGQVDSADERGSESGLEMGRRKLSVDLDGDAGEESESATTSPPPPPQFSSQTSPHMLSSSPEEVEMRRKHSQSASHRQHKPPRRISLSTALKERPLGNSLCYVKWREKLIKKGELAGRGESVILYRMGRGRTRSVEKLAKGPWQIPDPATDSYTGRFDKHKMWDTSQDEDEGYEQGDESDGTSTKRKPADKRRRKKAVQSDQQDTTTEEENDDSHSDYEWVGWKNDAGYVRERPVVVVGNTSMSNSPSTATLGSSLSEHHLIPKSSSSSGFGFYTPGVTTPSLPWSGIFTSSTNMSSSTSSYLGDITARRGSVPFLAAAVNAVGAIGTASGPAPPSSYSPPSRARGNGSGASGDASPSGTSSFADVVTGRSRSKSVATITPHSPYHHSPFLASTSEAGDTQSTVPPTPAVYSPRDSPASSTFSTKLSSPSRPETPGSAGGRRTRSSTIAASVVSPTSPLGLGILLPKSPKPSSPSNVMGLAGGSGTSTSQGTSGGNPGSPRSPKTSIHHQRSTHWTNPTLALLGGIPRSPVPRRATTTDSGNGYEDIGSEDGKRSGSKDDEAKMYNILEALKIDGPGRRRGNSSSTIGTEESDMSLTSALNLPDPDAPVTKGTAANPLTSAPAPVVLQKSPRVLTKERPAPSPTSTISPTPSSSQTPTRNSSSITVAAMPQKSASDAKQKKKTKPKDLKVVTDSHNS